MQGMKSTKVHVFSKRDFDRKSVDEAVKRYGGKFVHVLENDRYLYIIKGIHSNVINNDISLLTTLKPINGRIEFPKHSFCSAAYISALASYISDAHSEYRLQYEVDKKYMIIKTVNDFI